MTVGVVLRRHGLDAIHETPFEPHRRSEPQLVFRGALGQLLQGSQLDPSISMQASQKLDLGVASITHHFAFLGPDQTPTWMSHRLTHRCGTSRVATSLICHAGGATNRPDFRISVRRRRKNYK
jgi:hypothetical protein